MSFPSDISLSSTAKYYAIIDPINDYNANWDIVWSFTYSLSGSQHGFSTFLSTTTTPVCAYPGHYLGYDGWNGILGIGFDSTGYFALSTPIRSGVSLSEIKPNSLILRDSFDMVVYNESLSSLDTNFILSSSVPIYQTLRFRYCNAGKNLYIDYKTDDSQYTSLVNIQLSSSNILDSTIVYPGFSYCSPISGFDYPSTMTIKNFHSQGSSEYPTYEAIPMVPLSSVISSSYTTLSGISANPLL